AEAVVALVHGVQPERRQAGRYRVGFAQRNLEFVLRAVAAAASGRGVVDPFAGFIIIDVGAVMFVTTAPTAEANHVIVGRPLGEGVVGGVDDDQSAAITHVGFEGGAGGVGPGRGLPAKVGNHHVVGGEIGSEPGIGAGLFQILGFSVTGK